MESVGKIQSFDVSSPDDINNVCAQLGWNCFFTQLEAGTFSGSCFQRSWNGVNTLSVTLSLAAGFRQSCWPGYGILGNLMSEAPAKINGLNLRPSSFFVLMPGSSFCVTTTGPVTIHAALIPESEIEVELANACQVKGNIVSDVTVISSGIDEQAEHFKNWYLHWLSNPNSQDAQTLEILSQQLNEVLHSMLEQFCENPAVDAGSCQHEKIKDSNHRILELIDHFYQHPEISHTTAEMSAIADMNRRSFFYHFKNFTGYSPHQFFRYIRLQAVRQELLNEVDNISDLAERLNFHHHGEFSELYKKIYGELPSETRRKTLIRISGCA